MSFLSGYEGFDGSEVDRAVLGCLIDLRVDALVLWVDYLDIVLIGICSVVFEWYVML